MIYPLKLHSINLAVAEGNFEKVKFMLSVKVYQMEPAGLKFFTHLSPLMLTFTNCSVCFVFVLFVFFSF